MDGVKEPNKESYIEQKKTLGTVTYEGTALSVLFGVAPTGKTWDDIFYVQTWEGSFGGKQKSEAYQVTTTDESVTRMISEKYVDGVKEPNKESYIEQKKTLGTVTYEGTALSVLFGVAPTGKTWDDIFYVQTWEGSFGGKQKSEAYQVTTTDESVTRMISEKYVDGVKEPNKESYIEQKKTLGSVTYEGTALSVLFGVAPTGKTWDDIFYVQTWEGSFGGEQKSEAYQVTTTDESVTRMISEKYVDGVKEPNKESYIEQKKTLGSVTYEGTALSVLFGVAPTGKTWDDIFYVQTWEGSFGGNRNPRLIRSRRRMNRSRV